MQDFASAAMVRLLVRGMHAHGMALPPGLQALQGGPAGSHVPLHCKRAVVEAILQQGGPGALLRLAQRVDLLQGDPVHRALVGARGMPALLLRWQRLERYVHSRHQVSVLACGAQWLQLHHHARAGTPPSPQATESLAVLGVLLGAGHAAGVPGLRAELAGAGWHLPADATAALAPHGAHHRHGAHHGHDAPGVHDAALARCMAQGQAGHWVLRWDGSQGAEQEAAAAGCAGPAQASDTTLCDALPWPPLALQLARHVLHDPAAPHTVQTLAHHAGLARRSLQRALAGSGLSCRTIVAEVRARAAARWLLQAPQHGLAEIGFACGFADQPHFTREFTRQVGLTPARYRQAFAGAA